MVEEVHIQENVSDHYIFGNNNNFMSDLNQKKNVYHYFQIFMFICSLSLLLIGV